MGTFSEKFYSDIFRLGAAWNLGVGLGNLTFFKTSMRLFFGKEAMTDNSAATLPLRFFYIAIAIFGWGYYMVSRDLTKNRGIIFMGMASKVIIFGFFAYYFRLKKLKPIAMLAACIDLAFTYLFGLAACDTVKNKP